MAKGKKRFHMDDKAWEEHMAAVLAKEGKMGPGRLIVKAAERAGNPGAHKNNAAARKIWNGLVRKGVFRKEGKGRGVTLSLVDGPPRVKQEQQPVREMFQIPERSIADEIMQLEAQCMLRIGRGVDEMLMRMRGIEETINGLQASIDAMRAEQEEVMQYVRRVIARDAELAVVRDLYMKEAGLPPNGPAARVSGG